MLFRPHSIRSVQTRAEFFNNPLDELRMNLRESLDFQANEVSSLFPFRVVSVFRDFRTTAL